VGTAQTVDWNDEFAYPASAQCLLELEYGAAYRNRIKSGYAAELRNDFCARELGTNVRLALLDSLFMVKAVLAQIRGLLL